MFSCVVAGRLPLPPPQQIDETHAVFQLDAADQINHIVVFMTGEQPFPEGYGATVHLMWPKDPGSQAPSQWQLLGCLQNTKPSAIFRIRDPKREAAAVPGMTRTATLGISIEALADVERQMQSLTGNAPPATSTPNQASQSLALAAKTSPDSLLQQASALAAPIAQNVFDYLSSFAPDSAPQAVPLLQRWLEQFQRKLQSQGIEYILKSTS